MNQTISLRLFGWTNFEGKASMLSNPGIISPSKKLKQLAFFPFWLVNSGLYPSTALYLGLKSFGGRRESCGILIPPTKSPFSKKETSTNKVPIVLSSFFNNISFFSKLMKTYTPITFSFKHFVPKNFLLHFEQFIDLQHCTV